MRKYRKVFLKKSGIIREMEKADRSGGILGVPDREKDMY